MGLAVAIVIVLLVLAIAYAVWRSGGGGPHPKPHPKPHPGPSGPSGPFGPGSDPGPPGPVPLGPHSCDIPFAARRPYPAASAADCTAKGGCVSTGSPGECYAPRAPTTPCLVDYDERVNPPGCGTECADEATCLQHGGACFEVPPSPTNAAGGIIPWCYQQKKDACAVPATRRLNLPGCGADCTVESVCAAKGGCFQVPKGPDAANPRAGAGGLTPWCYTPEDPCYVEGPQRVAKSCAGCADPEVCLGQGGTCWGAPPGAQFDAKGHPYPWCYLRGVTQCPPPLSQSKGYDVNGLHTVACASLTAGGGGRCAQITGYKLPTLQWTVDPSEYALTTQRGADYTQVWTNFTASNAHMPTTNSDPGAGDLPKTNLRTMAIAYPTGIPPPPGGWPYVFQYEFMTSAGMGIGWAGGPVIGGIAETDMQGGTIVDDATTGSWSYILYRRHVVKAGFALVMISELLYDTELYSDCTSTKDVQDMCWNGGENADYDALRYVFEKLRVDPAALGLPPGQRLDYNRCAVSGYSVGAQSVARFCDSFPMMKTETGHPFPTIRAAVLVGGGSIWCYDYPGAGGSSPPPKAFRPCAAPEIGCCPTNRTGPNFDTGAFSWGTYPPTLLVQGEKDVYAAWEAASNFFRLLSARGVPVYQVMGPPLPDNPSSSTGEALGRHGVYDCQLATIIGFLLAYV